MSSMVLTFEFCTGNAKQCLTAHVLSLALSLITLADP